MIETQSFSSEEDETASHIEAWFKRYNIDYKRTVNNVWAINKHFDENKPTLYPVEIILNHGTKAIQARELMHGDGNENERRRIVRKERKRVKI